MPRDWAPDFLAALQLAPNVAAACREAGVARKTAYARRKADPAFAEAWQEALDESTDELVGEMYRRAVHGVDKPHFYKDGVAGYVREYSDTLAIFLAKTHRPDVYGDRLKADVTSGGRALGQVVFFMPQNGRDRDRETPGDPTAAGPADGVPGDAG